MVMLWQAYVMVGGVGPATGSAGRGWSSDILQPVSPEPSASFSFCLPFGGERVGGQWPLLLAEGEIETIRQEGLKHEPGVGGRAFGRHGGANIEALVFEPAWPFDNLVGGDIVRLGDQIDDAGIAHVVAGAAHKWAARDLDRRQAARVDIGGLKVG